MIKTLDHLQRVDQKQLKLIMQRFLELIPFGRESIKNLEPLTLYLISIILILNCFQQVEMGLEQCSLIMH